MTGPLGGVYLLAADYRRLHVSYASLGAKIACRAFEHIIFHIILLMCHTIAYGYT